MITDKIKNIAIIQQVFIQLIGFVKEIRGSFPTPPGPGHKSDWRIEFDENLGTFRLLFGDATRVYVNIKDDTYTLEFIYHHLTRKVIRVASCLPRKIAQEFLQRSFDSLNFIEHDVLTQFNYDDEETQDFIHELLENTDYQRAIV